MNKIISIYIILLFVDKSVEYNSKKQSTNKHINTHIDIYNILYITKKTAAKDNLFYLKTKYIYGAEKKQRVDEIYKERRRIVMAIQEERRTEMFFLPFWSFFFLFVAHFLFILVGKY